MQDITVTVVKSKRRKTAEVVVRPDCTVKITVPAFLSPSDINRILKKKQNWIQNKLNFFRNANLTLPEHQFTEGEIFTYLGKNYPLHITKIAAAKASGVKLKNGCLNLFLKDLSSSKTRKRVLITNWYKEKATEYLTKQTASIAIKHGLSPQKTGVKTYKRKWGCCNAKKQIFFNWKLIMAPPVVVHYVIIHELCHLLHPNHSRDFWDTVEQFMPDYFHHKTWLIERGFELDL